MAVLVVDIGAGRAGLVGSGRLVRAADAVSVLEAGRVLDAAKAEAARLLAQAGQEGEAIRIRAHADGTAAAQAELQDRLIELAEASLNVIARTEQRIIDLGLQIAQRIVGDLDPGDVTARVALRSLKLAGRSSFIRLRVAPGAADPLRARLDKEMPGTLASAAIEVVADPRVRDSGCILETDAGLVDATIDSQVDALRRGLLNGLIWQE